MFRLALLLFVIVTTCDCCCVVYLFFYFFGGCGVKRLFFFLSLVFADFPLHLITSSLLPSLLCFSHPIVKTTHTQFFFFFFLYN